MRMREHRGLRLAGPAVALAGVAALVVTSLAAPAGAAQRQAAQRQAAQRQGAARAIWVTRVFRYVGHTQHFFVPPGIHFLIIRAVGAAGESVGTTLDGPVAGGRGAVVGVGAFVRPFSVLAVDVGGSGAQGGFNGGGLGGGSRPVGGAYGGTGGGASSVSSRYRLLIVAAGGGGAGYEGACGSTDAYGGAGGSAGAGGSSGVTCSDPETPAGGGGGGLAGTLIAGGGGGLAGSGSNIGVPGIAGDKFTGGAGTATAPGARFGDSGGGGGGWYGGGGGGTGGLSDLFTGGGGGGGGGSSLGRVLGLAYGPAAVIIRYRLVAPLRIITSSPLPAAFAGHFYRTRLMAVGGTRPYHWSMFAGRLPFGLYLHATGYISGVPRFAGTRVIYVRVTDSHRRRDLKRFALTVFGRADLAVRLSHVGFLRYHRIGAYRVDVANTGSAATTRLTRMTLALPAGVVAQRAGGFFWHCVVRPHYVSCARGVPIRAQARTVIGVTVFVRARPGTLLLARATVRPLDATPRDNTWVNVAIVRR